MVLNNPDTIGISKSQFYMLRCLIAMAHADGVFHDDERDYIETMMNRNSLSDEQISTLRTDMEMPQDVGGLFTEIEDPKFRGQVVYFARLMAHKDGVLDPSEEDLIERLHGYAMEKVDIDEVRDIVGKVLESRLPEKEDDHSFMRWLDETLQDNWD